MVCLDTTFLVDLLRGDERARIKQVELDNSNEEIMITVPSIVELRRGLKVGNPKKGEREKIEELMNSFNILNLEKESALLSGDIEGDLIIKGEIIDFEDILIAGITIANDQVLITKNTKHFKRIKELEIEEY